MDKVTPFYLLLRDIPKEIWPEIPKALSAFLVKLNGHERVERNESVSILERLGSKPKDHVLVFRGPSDGLKSVPDDRPFNRYDFGPRINVRSRRNTQNETRPYYIPERLWDSTCALDMSKVSVFMLNTALTEFANLLNEYAPQPKETPMHHEHQPAVQHFRDVLKAHQEALPPELYAKAMSDLDELYHDPEKAEEACIRKPEKPVSAHSMVYGYCNWSTMPSGVTTWSNICGHLGKFEQSKTPPKEVPTPGKSPTDRERLEVLLALVRRIREALQTSPVVSALTLETFGTILNDLLRIGTDETLQENILREGSIGLPYCSYDPVSDELATVVLLAFPWKLTGHFSEWNTFHGILAKRTAAEDSKLEQPDGRPVSQVNKTPSKENTNMSTTTPLYSATIVKKAKYNRDGETLAPASIVGKIDSFTAVSQNAARAQVIAKVAKDKDLAVILENIEDYEVQICIGTASFLAF